MCLRELPELNRVYESFHEQGVQVIAVGTGSRERMEEIRQRYELTLPIAIGSEAWLDKLEVRAFPQTLFINAQGQIVERLQGGQNEAYFSDRLQTLLAHEEPGTSPLTGKHRLYERFIYRIVRIFRP